MKARYDEVETCPVCGCNEVEYGDSEFGIQGNTIYYEVKCLRCYTTWEEWYNIVFECVENVRLANGEEEEE